MTTDTEQTAIEIADVLGIPAAKVTVNPAATTVTLTNAQARRLLSIAKQAKDAFLVLDETDGVEVLAALAFAAQIYATTGDKVVSDHYSGLHAALQFVRKDG